MALFPNLADIQNIGAQVTEFVSFGKQALETIIGNQRAIYAKLEVIEKRLPHEETNDGR